MNLSLPLFMVICLVGYSMGLQNTQTELKTKIICDECELNQLKTTQSGLDRIKLVKLQKCLISKKQQIDAEEQQKKAHRQARSATTETETETPAPTFAEIFKNSAAFKRILKQYVQLKQNVIEKTNDLQRTINNALVQFAAEDSEDDDIDEQTNQKEQQKQQLPVQPTQQQQTLRETAMKVVNLKSTCDNQLKCDKPGQVIRIKSGLLTDKDNDKLCPTTTGLNLQHMNESCSEREKTTRILADLCDGETECQVNLATQFNELCDCTEKKHLEIKYTCEKPSKEATQKRAKRALYYQNNPTELRQNNIHREQLTNFYDFMYGYDYLNDYLYDYCLDDYYYAYPDYCDYAYTYDIDSNYVMLNGKQAREEEASVAESVKKLSQNQQNPQQNAQRPRRNRGQGSNRGSRAGQRPRNQRGNRNTLGGAGQTGLAPHWQGQGQVLGK